MARDEAVVEAFRVVRRRQRWISFGGVLATLTAMGVAGAITGDHESVQGLAVVGVLVAGIVAIVVASRKNFRCPACKQVIMRKTMSPRTCDSCRAELM